MSASRSAAAASASTSATVAAARPVAASRSRRDFLRECAAGALLLATVPRSRAAAAGGAGAGSSGAAALVWPLDRDWLFGGKFTAAAAAPRADESGFVRVQLPHAVTRQSWQKWDPAAWQDVWLYRRHFTVPEDFRGRRVFLHFAGVMVGATPTLNGHALPTHLGGYLPFRYEITSWLVPGDNVLAVAVDARWMNVPPQGDPAGAKRVDYLEIGGIHRSVWLEAVPAIHLQDVFAKPVRVLAPDRAVDLSCTIDAAGVPAPGPTALAVELREGERVLARTRQDFRLAEAGPTEVRLTLTGLGAIQLWDVDRPQLYRVVTTLLVGDRPVHDHAVRIGFREARFTCDGFFLNGRRLQLFGLNRHEVYPYVGYAMPPRVLRRDAALLRHELNCNIVRCSHYPQSPAFLDACDELGLLVWEEVPGWQYLGDAAWKDLALRDVRDMIVRDRNRPSIVIWGTRINESPNDVELYRKTHALAKALDDSRPTSGSMTPESMRDWKTAWSQDVFAFDDYHADPDGSVGILEPVPGHPYLLAEAVGQFNYTKRKYFTSKYRRAGEVELQQQQALRHAQAHSKAARYPRHSGVIAWCAFDYSSLVNPYQNLKCPGVVDSFRIPKLGGTFYLAQGDPAVRPVIEPNFYWDFGPQTPRGPGRRVAIFSNCERLAVFVDGRPHAEVAPDVAQYPHLRHAPFFVDLDCDGSGRPELRIDGFVGGRVVLSRSFSADASQDRLHFAADDGAIAGDGIDATRLEFRVVDRYGATRAFGRGTVTLTVAGPGEIVGDNPFLLDESGGVGAVWLRTLPGAHAPITVTATHALLGRRTVTVEVLPAAERPT